ncbi:MAG: nucleotidyltransferase domain-containing protein [Candidatus Margulisbacteria bacterium]|nr:nucleotidyltransferase domain-containing protein [Candidatus Margulisiibacteriota bacterium]
MDILEIARSKLRKELLSYYFTNPGSRCYLRELERILGFPVGNIRRELTKLEKIRLFTSEKVGNLVYYFLNKKCPLYNEIKNIVLKTAGLGDVFKKKLKKIKGIKFAFIYGSFAKGEEIKTSDIDFMIIGDIKQDKLVAALHEVEDKIGRTINYVSFSQKEVVDRIKRKNHFILNVFKSKRIMIFGNENELQIFRK